MIKVTSPVEVVLNSAEKNEFCRDFILRINDMLAEAEPADRYKFSVETEDKISTEDAMLLTRVFSLFGWEMAISPNIGEEDGEIVYINTIVLTPKMSGNGGKN